MLSHTLLLSRAALDGAGVALAGLTVGLAGYVAVLEALWLGGRNPTFHALSRRWARPLAVAAAAALAVWSVAAAAGALPPEGWLTGGVLVRFLLGGGLATALLVAAASAWRLLAEPDEPHACMALRMAIGTIAIAAPLQIVGGALAGDHIVLAPPPAIAETSSLWGLRAAALLDLAMLGLGLWGAWLCWRSAPENGRRFLKVLIVFAPAGVLALAAAWAAPAAPDAFAAAWSVPGLAALALGALLAGAGLVWLVGRLGEGPAAAS